MDWLLKDIMWYIKELIETNFAAQYENDKQ